MAEQIIQRPIEEELTTSYLNYSMSVIVARALPDVRDGLKPSQRRILYAMQQLNLHPGHVFRKCARIAGDTSGKFHPHGEQVVYPTLVRMAQDFNMRYTLVNGQGNFGSIDGDPPAAMRYTEAKLTHLSMELLADLDKDTVDFQANYDDTEKEPVVFAAGFPNLLANGSSGIAVGMATNMPPHNLTELIDGICAYIDNPEIGVDGLLQHIKGPDFPTGGIILGRSGIHNYFRSGRGKITIRAVVHTETKKNGRESIIITELPYQTNKAMLLQHIAELVKNKKIEGISDLRDESDRKGMRVVIELKRNENADVVLNQLYKFTSMQSNFGVINLALVKGQPQTLSMKDLIREYVNHRHEVVERRTRFLLDKAEKRAHILEGLRIALNHLDEVIRLIRGASDPKEAKTGLMENFELSDVQAQAILDMRLQRLTGLEREKIENEYQELIQEIARLKSILENHHLRMQIIKDELLIVKEKYGDERRTQIVGHQEDIEIEDLIAEEDMIITISHKGYIKRIKTDTYQRQGRGGRGKLAMNTYEDDFVEQLFVARTHDYILFFTNLGQCHWLKVYNIPEAGRQSKGKPIIHLLNLQKDEYIRAYVSVKEFAADQYVLMATRNGVLKKTALDQFSNPRKNGIRAILIDEDDELIDARITNGTQEVMLATAQGYANHFHENQVRPMGRSSRGVIGIRLSNQDHLVSMVAVHPSATLLTVTQNGYGKRSAISDYRLTKRGGKGIINVRVAAKNGDVVSVREVNEDNDLMVITREGIMIRIEMESIRVMGRNTQGVRVINLKDEDSVIDITCLPREDGDEEKTESAVQNEPNDLFHQNS